MFTTKPTEWTAKEIVEAVKLVAQKSEDAIRKFQDLNKQQSIFAFNRKKMEALYQLQIMDLIYAAAIELKVFKEEPVVVVNQVQKLQCQFKENK